MSSQPSLPELHPADISNLPPGVSLANVPAFEQPTAQNTTLAKGDPGSDGSIAHEATPIPVGATQEGSSYNAANLKNTVFVDQSGEMDQGTLNHEVLHAIQQAQNVRSYQAGLESRGNAPESNYNKNWRNTYDYGGIDGLEAMLQKGKNLSHLNSEQQAEVLKDYTASLQKFQQVGTSADPKLSAMNIKERNSPDSIRRKMQQAIDAEYDKAVSPAAFDRLQRVYSPFIHQMAEMARSAPGISTTPQPPGPPPAELTGQGKPLPEIGGRTIELHPDDLANHPKKGKR